MAEKITVRGALTGCLMASLVMLAGCERPPAQSAQVGYRGTGMAQVQNPRAVAQQAALHLAPEADAPSRVRANAPKAGTVYKNVQVLNEVSIAEFGRTMNAITTWVAPPEASCSYCHEADDFAADTKYTKVVARRMLQMTQQINSSWKAHVGETGVTCYTCHRGQPLPAESWFRSEIAAAPGRVLAAPSEQNKASRIAGGSSLPGRPFDAYLAGEVAPSAIRVAATAALPGEPGRSIQSTESTYGLMMHMSDALGVNCTFCHNSRAFADWGESTPQRATAWHGIRMARDINNGYLKTLDSVFPVIPEGRLGPLKDAARVNCATCHRGVNKPLNGTAMAPLYPALYPAESSAAPGASAPGG